MTALARAVVKYRFLVIGLWLVIAAIALPRAAQVNDVLQVQGKSLRPTEAAEAQAKIANAFARPVAKFIAVALQGPVSIDDPEYRVLVEDLSRTAAAQPYIDEVISFLSTRDSGLVSPDGHTTFILATFDGAHVTETTRLAPEFRTAIHRAAARHDTTRFRVYVTGEPALDHDTRTVSAEDARRAERRSLIPSAIVLVLAFGAIVAAVLPIIVGVFSISCALAAVHFVAAFHPMSVFVLMIVTMVGLGVGIDYSLLIVTRFREEMNHGLNPRQAAVRSLLTAGKAVVTSGFTVLVGFGTLLLTPLIETRSVGIGGLLVVGAAVIMTTTLLPAMLAILGRAIDWPRWLAARLAWYHAPTAWERWARWLSHHPWRAVLIALTLVVAITWPLGQIRIGLPSYGWFPDGTESSEGAALLEDVGSRGIIHPIRIVLEAPEGQRIVSARYLRGLKRFSDTIHHDPRVSRVTGPVDLEAGMSMLRYLGLYGNLDRARERYPQFFDSYISPDARTALMDVVLTDASSFNDGMELVRQIRTEVRGGLRGLDSVTVQIGGFAASSLDLQEDLLHDFPMLMAMVLGIIAVMLLIAFQSILVPIKAVIMNLLSVAGAFGLMVLVFQHGVGSRLFGVPAPTNAIYVAVPVLVFAVVFGLSMDYEVFLLSRMKEAFHRTHKNDLATMEGLSVTASVITSAAAIMIIVFGMFAFSRVFVAKLMGFGLAVAVFLDATLIRMVLVPAFMHIAGRWNWWPGVPLSATPPPPPPPASGSSD